jgi:hypothetical protein
VPEPAKGLPPPPPPATNCLFEESISFKKNKLICFDAKKLHRGLAPKKGVRITVVFKTEIIGEKNDR